MTPTRSPQDRNLDSRVLHSLESSGLENSHLICAFSGGLDSTVLLHAASRAFTDPESSVKITACHVDHKLNPSHERWAAHCQTVCNTLEIPLIIHSVDVTGGSQGLEAEARDARYQVFESLLTDEDTVLLTAHHLDDQAETVLLNFTRSLGFHSQRGIPVKRALGQGSVFRPFLTFSRTELASYANMHNLEWIEDESNYDTRFDRNFIRHEVLPRINSRWSTFNKNVARVADLANQQIALLDEIARADLELCLEEQSPFGSRIDLDALLELTPIRQKNAIARWFHDDDVVHINRELWRQIEGILNRIEKDSPTCCELQLKAADDSERLYAVYDGYLLRQASKTFSYNLDKLDAAIKHLREPLGQAMPSHSGGVRRSQVSIDDYGELQIHSFQRAAEPLTVALPLLIQGGRTRYHWQHAGQFRAIKVNGIHKKIKNLFQDARVPKWHRASFPVLCADGEPLAIPGVAIADQARPGEGNDAKNQVLLTLDWRFF